MIPQTILELEAALPVLKEKEQQGLILPSYEKAASLVAWGKSGKPLSEKQLLFVGRLLLRAKRKHKGGVVIAPQASMSTDAVVAEVLEKLGGVLPKQDEAAIVAKVVATLDARLPRKVEIHVKKDAGPAKKVDGTAHCKFEHLLRAATARVQGFAPGIFLQGEASSGKTTGTRMLAEALGLDWYFNGAISMPHEMLGFIDGAGKYHRTPFRDAYEKGGVYTFDEVDRCDPVALLTVNPHLAGAVATFPDKQVKRHKDCVIVATANTWGLGGNSEYSGATKLDAAFLSRFPVRINWDIDEALESAIVPHPTWLAMVRRARTRARVVGLKVMIDTRAAQAGYALIQAGYSEQEAASMTYLANLKPEQRTQLEAA